MSLPNGKREKEMANLKAPDLKKGTINIQKLQPIDMAFQPCLYSIDRMCMVKAPMREPKIYKGKRILRDNKSTSYGSLDLKKLLHVNELKGIN